MHHNCLDGGGRVSVREGDLTVDKEAKRGTGSF